MLKQKILIVDDDPDILDILKIILEDKGYEVIEGHNGKEALDIVKTKSPDLVIIDLKMPYMNGDEVCKILKDDILLQHIPIIMLTAKGETSDKIHGINSGADDYIVKPFEREELTARVKMTLRRTARDLDANPLTRLPGNVSILNELQERLDKNELFSIGYIDIDKFKAFNDNYGFKRGDEMIKSTAKILISSIQEKGTTEDFMGHIGGDDFVIITSPQNIEQICKNIIAKFEVMAPTLYNEEDRQKGYIVSKDRQGNEERISFLTISIGIVTNEHHMIKHVAEIGEIGAELKRYAKSLPGNKYVTERRHPT